MDIQEYISLSDYSTMKIGGAAKYLVKVNTKDQVVASLNWAKEHNLPFRVIGSGSNIVFSDKGYSGLIVVNEIKEFEATSEDSDSSLIKIGSGEDWDPIVERTVAKGLSGIEALSLIPGTAGATPIQNVGAYGQEIADTLTEVEVYDTEKEIFTTLAKAQCQFKYRDSVFKSSKKGRYIVISITLRLKRVQMTPPFYRTLQAYLDDHKITDYSPQNIRKAVIAIRTSKLPDPKVIANCGSFFKNPMVDKNKYEQLRHQYADIPGFNANGLIKLSAGWLIDKAGMGHYQKNGICSYEKHPLVLTNCGNAKFTDLSSAVNEIKNAVQNNFGVELEQEPEFIS